MNVNISAKPEKTKAIKELRSIDFVHYQLNVLHFLNAENNWHCEIILTDIQLKELQAQISKLLEDGQS